MLAGAAVGAQFVAGKAARDALFLANLEPSALPVAIAAAAGLSIALALAGSKLLPRASPATAVPFAFALSAVLFVVEWALLVRFPDAGAAALYLHVSGLGPILGSGFWLVASERFDPRTARSAFGQLAAAGTLGGVAGGVLADRLAAGMGAQATLPVLALLSVLAGWQVRRLAAHLPAGAGTVDLPPDLAAAPAASSLAALARVPYLRNLASVVLLGTLAATLLDYLMKVQASAVVGEGDALIHFFSLYYALTGVAVFALQAVSTRYATERLGLAGALAAPSAGVLAGCGAALIAPGLATTVMARGTESMFRGSIFRSAYEVFFTPLPPGQKRAAKSIVDVGFDRLGEASGAGIVALALLLPADARTVLLLAAMACSSAAVVVSRRLAAGYIHTLEHRLRDRAADVSLSEIHDTMTRTLMQQSLTAAGVVPGPARARRRPRLPDIRSSALDGELLQILALRSGDHERIRRVLDPANPLSARVAPHAILLLDDGELASDAMQALEAVADARVGELTDAIADSDLPIAVRRRAARVLRAASSQRAVDGLMLGLEAERIEVREQSGRSLVRLRKRHPALRIDADRVVACAVREAAALQTSASAHPALDHIFTLLSLVLPEAPLRIAYRSLRTDDPAMRGTALEYLEGVLPPDLRRALWPVLEPPATRSGR
jgi:hypothetical protein